MITAKKWQPCIPLGVMAVAAVFQEATYHVDITLQVFHAINSIFLPTTIAAYFVTVYLYARKPKWLLISYILAAGAGYFVGNVNFVWLLYFWVGVYFGFYY